MLSDEELRKLVRDILQRNPKGMGVTALAQAIAEKVEPDTDKRKELLPTLRNKLNRALPQWRGLLQRRGFITQTSKGENEYLRRGTLWKIRSRKRVASISLDASPMNGSSPLTIRYSGTALDKDGNPVRGHRLYLFAGTAQEEAAGLPGSLIAKFETDHEGTYCGTYALRTGVWRIHVSDNEDGS